MYQIIQHFQMRKVSICFIKKMTGKVFFVLKEKKLQEVQEKLNRPFYFCFKESKNFKCRFLCEFYNVESHRGLRGSKKIK